MNRSRWDGRYISGKLIFFVPAAIVVYLILPPLILLVVSTFKSTADRLPLEPGPWTIQNYINVFANPDTYLVLQNSLIYALVTVIVALAIGCILVWLIERSDLPARNVVFGLVLLPIAIPALVKALGWSMLANPTNGLLNALARSWFGLEGHRGPLNIYSLGGIIFVSALSHVPSVTLMIAGAFRNFDPVLEEASQLSGASWASTQRRITLPLLKPSVLAAFIYFFASSLDDFQIPAVLGLNSGIHVFSTQIYLATHPARGLSDFGLAGTYSMLLLAIALVLILMYRRMVRKGSKFAVVTGKGFRPGRTRLGKWKYAAFAGVAVYLVLGVLLPMLALLWVSFQPFFVIPSMKAIHRMSWNNYTELLNLGQFNLALVNTLIIAPIVATLAMFLSTLIAWNAARGKGRGREIPDFLTFINLAVPTVVFGLAILFVYLSFPPLRVVYGTIWILIIAFTTRYLTYATRLMGAAVIQIHKELEEGSETSGASRFQTFMKITLPLLMPSFLNGWLWVTINSLQEVTLAVMLMTPANIVLASLIWARWQDGVSQGSVAAISVMVVGLTSVLAVVSRLPIFNRIKY